ncbi:MAG TPA: hypothetical protein ENH97_02755 [bacterium]|nr:hypothetical protein [bacterium]
MRYRNFNKQNKVLTKSGSYSAFQYATINKRHDYIHTGEDKINWELLNGIIFSIPTPLKIAKRPIRFRAEETYIYDLDSHRGTRNEVEGGLFWRR